MSVDIIRGLASHGCITEDGELDMTALEEGLRSREVDIATFTQIFR